MPGPWLAASAVLGRPVTDAEAYPHICGRLLAADRALHGRPVLLQRRDCAACAEGRYERRHSRPIPDTPPAPPERTRTMSDNPLLTAALAHAARGWHVFPLRPDDKRPAFPDHPADDCAGRDPRCRAAGHHLGWEPRATTDPDRIHRAWSARSYGIGIACGPSRLAVVDLDVRKPGQTMPPGHEGCPHGLRVLAELAAAHAGTIDPTYTVTTGRGGTHLYYRHPDGGPALRNTAGTLGPMVDTRAHGGYVVAAGSTVAGRPYTVDLDTDPAPLPGWLAGLLAPAPLPPQRPVVVDLGTSRASGYVRAAVAREVDRVTTAPAGERNRALYIAAVALGQLVAGGALSEDDAQGVLEQAGVDAGLRTVEAFRTVRSGLTAGARRPRTVAA
ncbi:bifunctional DNA primase/polymerase [Micromonospora sp. WMMA1998]|uniref:bifunctional DNA primase/polymerase n=1 Tax=Micromonospora sp. WMMA1998 TaxID=3015167 RepID=UPI00248C3C27|nr:bifunctional DNA primase/polymerase [Micromonospora sp. WMMA1998]WBC17732.1 bifunctional DNA primase/polymerase [Micromonospora sp. WMMA1998]